MPDQAIAESCGDAIDPQVPNLTANAIRVLENRYLDRDKDGITETPYEMFSRVAYHVASKEGDMLDYWADKFREVMVDGRFMPNSPTLMNAGRNDNLLSACFVLPVKDDTKQIFKAIQDTAVIQKAGGGTGFAFDQLRPCGAHIKSSGGTSSGPIAFWRVFSEATSAIQQGSFRRGANLAAMSLDYPDIIKFIFAKQDLKQFDNYNISIKVTDEHMSLLKDHPDSLFQVKWGDESWYVPKEIVERCASAVAAGVTGISQPRGLDVCYGLSDLVPINEVDFALTDTDEFLSVSDVFDLIIKHAWKTGEPGLLFIDRVREVEPTPHTGLIHATNPCVTGDTRILTVDGPRSFKHLCDSGIAEIDVHAWDPDTKLPVIRRMRNIHKTRSNTDTVEVEFDSGLVVRCTPDHNFRTFRGDKVQAQDLRIGQSVRAYAVSHHRDGHQRAHAWVANKCAHQWVHRMVLESRGIEIPEGLVVDHIDGNPDNNCRDNLRLLTPVEHNSHHYPSREANGFGRHGWKTPEDKVNQKISASLQAHYGGNHKVVAVRDAGINDVYNGTVDDVHTYIIVDPEYRGDSDSGLWSGIVSCNCGEQYLQPDEACNLGSINLKSYVTECYEFLDHISDEIRNAHIDWDQLAEDIETYVRMLDNVIDVNNYPTKAIDERCKANRKIGLGVMGFADTLIRLGVRYDSDEGLQWAAKFMNFVATKALAASEKLAEERGVFPSWKGSRWEARGIKVRNADITCVAPTGTISIIADTSCGIEPLFSFVFMRQVLGGQKMMEYHKEFGALARKYGFDTDEIKEYAFRKGSIQDCDIPIVAKNILRSARDISPEWHVRMQAVFQKFSTNAISKTINLPHNAKEDDVRSAYILAHELKCKGVTVYRDGCRDFQPMALDNQSEISAKQPEPMFSLPVEVSDFMPSVRTRYDGAYGNLHTNISFEQLPDGRFREREIFFNLGRSGDGVHPMIEVFGRLASMVLRLDGSIDLIIDQMRNHVIGGGNGQKPTSPPNELSKALLDYFIKTRKLRDSEGFLLELPGSRCSESVKVAVESEVVDRTQEFIDRTIRKNKLAGTYRIPCPVDGCEGELVYAEGCQKCLVCGEGACS